MADAGVADLQRWLGIVRKLLTQQSINPHFAKLAGFVAGEPV